MKPRYKTDSESPKSTETESKPTKLKIPQRRMSLADVANTFGYTTDNTERKEHGMGPKLEHETGLGVSTIDATYKTFHKKSLLDIYLNACKDKPINFNEWLKNFIKQLPEDDIFKKYYTEHPLPEITYLDDNSRKNYETKLINGELYVNSNHPHFKFSEEQKKEQWIKADIGDIDPNLKSHRNEKLIFALSKDNSGEHLYIGRDSPGVFHHSSFTKGVHIISAGELTPKQGKITYLSNESGHFQPPIENFRTMIEYLNQNKAATSLLSCVEYRKRGILDKNKECKLQLLTSIPEDDKIINNDLYLFLVYNKIWYRTKTQERIVNAQITKKEYPFFDKLLATLRKSAPQNEEIEEKAKETLLELALKKGHIPLKILRETTTYNTPEEIQKLIESSDALEKSRSKLLGKIRRGSTTAALISNSFAALSSSTSSNITPTNDKDQTIINNDGMQLISATSSTAYTRAIDNNDLTNDNNDGMQLVSATSSTAYTQAIDKEVETKSQTSTEQPTSNQSTSQPEDNAPTKSGSKP